jgi:hypothetical protein
LPVRAPNGRPRIRRILLTRLLIRISEFPVQVFTPQYAFNLSAPVPVHSPLLPLPSSPLPAHLVLPVLQSARPYCGLIGALGAGCGRCAGHRYFPQRWLRRGGLSSGPLGHLQDLHGNTFPPEGVQVWFPQAPEFCNAEASLFQRARCARCRTSNIIIIVLDLRAAALTVNCHKLVRVASRCCDLATGFGWLVDSRQVRWVDGLRVRVCVCVCVLCERECVVCGV